MSDPFLDSLDIPEIDFSAEVPGILHLQDCQGAIPQDEDLDYYSTIEPLIREEWFPVIIRMLFCAASRRVTSSFFAELILREAITFESLQSFIAALESTPSPVHSAEMALFNDILKRLRSAHSNSKEALPHNVTNAVVGYAKDIKEPREEYMADWFEEIRERVKWNAGMNPETREKFNTFPLKRILELPVQ